MRILVAGQHVYSEFIVHGKLPQRTTALVLTQGHDPVGQAEGRAGIHVPVAQAYVGPHYHVAPILAPSVFGVALVEPV